MSIKGPVLNANIPSGPVQEKWEKHKASINLVNPANKRKYTVIVVGTGLAGASAAATLGELGYHVLNFCIHDSPRRAHSVAAQGGINASKNYQNDGDSVWRLFQDTVKGGDYRAREANVYRLAELSENIIDQCVAAGVPFARDYSGMLSNRSFGGAQVSRTFYARGQTGQQLLLGCYSALMRQVGAGQVEQFSRREMLDVVMVDGRARGILCRNLVTGEMEKYAADAVCVATGGYATVYFLSTCAVNCNATALWRCHKKGAVLANPSFAQIHPTCLPQAGESQSKLTLMSESLRNDGRVWVPAKKGDPRPPQEIPEAERDYFLERKYPAFGNLAPRDISSRAAKEVCDAGYGVGKTGYAVYLDFADAINRLGKSVVHERYSNLFAMYEEITDEDPFTRPMRIYPAPHYTMGGLWVDYNLMTTVPGLYALGEANFSDHGANRLGASALMQGLADGYFILPITIGDFLSTHRPDGLTTEHEAFDESERAVQDQVNHLLSINGSKTVREYHWELGRIMWDRVGMSRNESGLQQAISEIAALREDYWKNVKVGGINEDLNKSLEMAGRVADFLELGELMARDALDRAESCGGHLREEHQTENGEAVRNDKDYCHVSAWEYKGEEQEPERHVEHLEFDDVPLKLRDYT